MESYSYKMYSSSFSSSTSFVVHPQEEKKEKPYNSSLRRVRSLPSKPITKKPIAQSLPIPPKIYRVEAVNFREVVQMLTAAPEFQSHSDSPSRFGSRSLQEVAPPPLALSPTSLTSNNNIAEQLKEFLPPSSSKNSMVISTAEAINESIIEAQERQVRPRILSDAISGACSGPLRSFPLSPSSFAWCSSLLSPGTLTTSDTNAVL